MPMAFSHRSRMTHLERIALYLAAFVALWLIGTVIAALGVP